MTETPMQKTPEQRDRKNTASKNEKPKKVAEESGNLTPPSSTAKITNPQILSEVVILLTPIDRHRSEPKSPTGPPPSACLTPKNAKHLIKAKVSCFQYIFFYVKCQRNASRL